MATGNCGLGCCRRRRPDISEDTGEIVLGHHVEAMNVSMGCSGACRPWHPAEDGEVLQTASCFAPEEGGRPYDVQSASCFAPEQSQRSWSQLGKGKGPYAKVGDEGQEKPRPAACFYCPLVALGLLAIVLLVLLAVGPEAISEEVSALKRATAERYYCILRTKVSELNCCWSSGPSCPRQEEASTTVHTPTYDCYPKSSDDDEETPHSWPYEMRAYCCSHFDRGCGMDVPSAPEQCLARCDPPRRNESVHCSSQLKAMAKSEDEPCAKARERLVRDCPGCSACSLAACLERESAAYNCGAGYANWVDGWSEGKKAWCCKHESRGCPGNLAGN